MENTGNMGQTAMKPAARTGPIVLTLAAHDSHDSAMKLWRLNSSGTDQFRPLERSSTPRFFNTLRALDRFPFKTSLVYRKARELQSMVTSPGLSYSIQI